MNPLEAQITPAALLGLPYDEEWEALKPVIKSLYIEENGKLNGIIPTIGYQYGFHAP